MNIVVSVKQIPDPAVPGELNAGPHAQARGQAHPRRVRQLRRRDGAAARRTRPAGARSRSSRWRRTARCPDSGPRWPWARPRRSSSPTTRCTAPTRSTTAKVLAKCVERAGEVDLVLTATESTDGYTGTVPEQVAELLDWPSVTFAKHIEIADGTAKVQRQTEAGYDEVEAPLPAVVSVTAGVVEPRYPSFKGIMAAKTKPVDEVTVADLGLGADRSVGPAQPGDRVGRGGAGPRGRRDHRGRRRRRTRRSSTSSRSSRSSEPEGLRHGTVKIWVFAESPTATSRPPHARAAHQGAARSATPSRPCTRARTPTPSRRSSARTARPKVVHRRPRRRPARRRRRRRDRRRRRGRQQPDAILFAQSYDGRDALGRLSVKLEPDGADQQHRASRSTATR